MKPIAIVVALGAGLALALAPWSGSSESAASRVVCDLIAAEEGSDSAPGTARRPMRTAQALVDALHPGQTGCLRAGHYRKDTEVEIAVSGITLTSAPGERATLRARLWIERHADGVTISDLNLNGRNPKDLPSPTINADDVVIRGNDITNHHTAICISVGSTDGYGRAADSLIEGNRIHDCGELPATNHDHGIYVNASEDAIIRDNLIYDNADRGIQLYPDAQGTLITGNVIDGNGEGIIFSGTRRSASSNNLVEDNAITNSRIRDNVDSYWEGPVGSDNIVRGNCIGGGVYDDGDGGINQTLTGVAVIDNVVATADSCAAIDR